MSEVAEAEALTVDGWTRSPIGELCDVIRGVTYKKAQASEKPAKSRLPILRATNIQEGRLVLDSDLIYVPNELVSENQRLLPGDIVIATSSGSKHLVGKTAQLTYGWDGSFGAFCAAVRPKADISTRYLGCFFESPEYKKFIAQRALGVNINNLRKGDLEEISVPIAPRDQQDRIVAEIEKQFSRLDEAVASLKRVKANLKRYKAAVLKAAVEGKLTEEWRKQNPDVEPASKLLERILTERRTKWEEAELAKMKAKGKEPKNDKWRDRYKEPEPLIDGQVFEIPPSWAWTNLGQVSWSVKDGPHYSPSYTDNGIPFISGGNIRPNGIDFSSAKYISPELHEELSARCKPRVGDLLYTKGGTTGIAYCNTESREFNVWVHVAVIRLLKGIDGAFLQNTLNSPHCYRQSQLYTHGVGNQDLGLTRMIKITLPLPPIKEQEQISFQLDQRMSVVQTLEDQLENNLKRAERTRQSLLSAAFTGAIGCS